MPIIYLKAYFGAFLMFCIMDGLWLGVLATDFYFNSLEGMLLEEPNWPSAIVFYLGYIAGIVYFAIKPNLPNGSYKTVIRDGALLGLLAYATYDMTNMATLKNWPVLMTFVDIAWGGVLTCLSGVFGYLIIRALP